VLVDFLRVGGSQIQGIEGVVDTGCVEGGDVFLRGGCVEAGEVEAAGFLRGGFAFGWFGGKGGFLFGEQGIFLGLLACGLFTFGSGGGAAGLYQLSVHMRSQ